VTSRASRSGSPARASRLHLRQTTLARETDGYAFFNVIHENDGIVQPASQDLSSDSPTRVEGEATFFSGPGEYLIGISSEETSYALTVEDCDGSSAVQTASQRPVALPRTGQAETRRLLEAGGPTDGPVPTMPDGIVQWSTRSREVVPATLSSLRG
jgi:hypothetical protein